ncbi:Hsp20 family protein [Moritella sp. 24]|uniref:Hsp20 family protein n=1 Tax=Moritella sp. 24 TaxID=2746230 RepID=UPI001BA7C46E|nr:Hsp20 family protein [Moritella sp. 24]QUM77239.1 Hsp20 family protein [Moritella sp. 24]
MTTHFDFTPLYRSAIGFDRFAQVAERLTEQRKCTDYPRYNIVQLEENKYEITLAVAGFELSEIDIEVRADEVVISGQKTTDETEAKKSAESKFLHRGIAERNFTRKFELADHIEVKGADLANGLLTLLLERNVPEALQPRKISIGA